MQVSIPSAASVLRVLDATMALPIAERFVVVQISEVTKAYITAKVGFYTGVTEFQVSVAVYQSGGTFPKYSDVPGKKRVFPVESKQGIATVDAIRVAVNGALNYIDELVDEYKVQF